MIRQSHTWLCLSWKSDIEKTHPACCSMKDCLEYTTYGSNENIHSMWNGDRSSVLHTQWNIAVLSLAQSCLTLRNPMDCSPPGSSVHGNLQARILEWVAIPFSRGSSQPRDQTQVSHIAGRFFTIWATREAPNRILFNFKKEWNFDTYHNMDKLWRHCA